MLQFEKKQDILHAENITSQLAFDYKGKVVITAPQVTKKRA